MVVKSDLLPALYETDETAWLEEMVRRLQKGMFDGLDYGNLTEFLQDMAKRDRREIETRLVLLTYHWLKFDFQPERRTSSWRRTIVVQAGVLRREFASRTLRKHAETVLETLYPDAVQAAAAQTRLPSTTFPATCPYTLDQLLQADRVVDADHPSEPPPPVGRRKKRRPPGGRK